MNAVQVSTGRADLDGLPNLLRATALVLSGDLKDVLVVGAGHGPLARYLAQFGVNITVLDHSQAKLGIVRGEVQEFRARCVLADVTELGRHVAPVSQDAIFLTDVVEHIASSELLWAFRACRTALRPGGVCCVLTRERQYGPWRPPSVTDEDEGNRFEIDPLRGLLAESFEAVDVFTWNGTERSDTPGRSQPLFAVAHAGDPYLMSSIALTQPRAAAAGTSDWIAATVADPIALPPRFLLRARLHVRAAPVDSVIHFVFKTGDPARYFWTGIRPESLIANPAELLLSSEILRRVGGAQWGEVATMILRIRSASASECDIRISDVRLLRA